MELRLLRRQKGDTIYVLFDKIKRLSSLAWPGEESAPHVISANINTFAEVIESASTRKEILLKRPKSLEEALEIASCMEFIESSTREHVVSFEPDGKKKDKMYARSVDAQASAAIAIAPPDAAALAFQKQYDEMKAWHAEIKSAKSGSGGSRGRGGKGSNFSRGPGPRGPVVCYRCDVEGHVVRDCPQRGGTGTAPPSPGTKPPTAAVKGVVWGRANPQ